MRRGREWVASALSYPVTSHIERRQWRDEAVEGVPGRGRESEKAFVTSRIQRRGRREAVEGGAGSRRLSTEIVRVPRMHVSRS